MANKAFITGATGFLGAAIARTLQRSGYEIHALCRSRPTAERVRALGYSAVPGDLEQAGAWLDEVRNAQLVVHAAQVRPGLRLSRSWLKSARQMRDHGLSLLLTAAREGHACNSFIYTSGIAVMGDHGEDWIDEDATPRPHAMGQYHLEGERQALEAADAGLPVCILRPGFVYGADGSFAKYFLAAAAKGVYRYPGKGQNYISWVHADDMAQGYLLAARRPPVGQAICLVDDEPLRMDDFAQLLLNAFGGGRAQRVPRWLVAGLAGAPLAEMLTASYRVGNDKAKEVMGWQPRYPSFERGIAAVVDQYLGHAAVDPQVQLGAE